MKSERAALVDDQSAGFVPARKLNFSFESRFYIVMLLVFAVYFIASSIGSGWALFIAANLICFCFLSIALPALLLKSLVVALSGPEMLNAGEDIGMTAMLQSRRWQPYVRWIILRVAPSAETIFQAKPIEAMLLEKLETGAIALSCPGLKRGIRPLPPLIVETSFPFGLVWCKAEFRTAQMLAVLPKREKVEGQFLSRLRSTSYVPGESRNTSHGMQSSSSTRGIRNYTRGDSRRSIHWSSSARHGSLMVREFEKEGLPAFDVVFDLSCRWMSSEQFELAISATAAMLELGHNLGVHPDLVFLESAERLSGRSEDINQQLLLLAALEYKESTNTNVMDATQQAQFFEGRDKAVILISALTKSHLASLPPDAEHGGNKSLLPKEKSAANLYENAAKDAAEDVSESRNSVFAIRVSHVLGARLEPAHTSEFILSEREDFANL